MSKTPQIFLEKIGLFLVDRCKELGYIPIITKTPPPHQIFNPDPSPEAVYIKLFGHFNYNINTVHARFAVLDPHNLQSLGSLDDNNLCLTQMDKYLLISSLLQQDHSSSEKMSKNLKNLQEIYDIWSYNN